jgi:two-component system response regulator FlrC
MEKILITDDDAGFRKLLETILSGEGYEVRTAGSVAEAIRTFEQLQFHLVLSDLRLPDGDGISVLRWVKERAPEVPVIMMTAFGTVNSAVEAMKLGALDYLGKPLSSPDELRLIVRRALDQNRDARELDVLREESRQRFGCSSLIGEDPGLARVLEMAAKVAPTPATVLITGESGTGKEIVARCIHANSPRAQRVFVAVNCAALSPTLIESELFGHEKGAFTGAVAQYAGRFERAQGGTLFLDEIGELDGNLQAKLLRVLQERTFERVGGAKQIAADVRVIAATNRDIKQLANEGRFREDLYYRLTAFPIELPPLRERGGDVVLLARHFLDRAAKALSKPPLCLAPEAEQVLLAYSWPGNIRELENLMERMAILCDEVVEADDLPITPAGPVRPVLFKDIERQAIEDALRANDGNRTRTAKQLGISLRTLQYRLRDYGISPRARE